MLRKQCFHPDDLRNGDCTYDSGKLLFLELVFITASYGVFLMGTSGIEKQARIIDDRPLAASPHSRSNEADSGKTFALDLKTSQQGNKRNSPYTVYM